MNREWIHYATGHFTKAIKTTWAKKAVSMSLLLLCRYWRILTWLCNKNTLSPISQGKPAWWKNHQEIRNKVHWFLKIVGCQRIRSTWNVIMMLKKRSKDWWRAKASAPAGSAWTTTTSCSQECLNRNSSMTRKIFDRKSNLNCLAGKTPKTSIIGEYIRKKLIRNSWEVAAHLQQDTKLI